MTKDELKALWAELGENHYNHRIGDYANEIPPGPPRPGYDVTRLEGAPRARDARDPHPRREEAAAGQPAGLPAPRARSTRSGTTASTSTSPPTTRSPAAAPAPSGSSLELHANSGSMLNGQDDKDRVINYEYSLVYGLDGQVDETNPYAADWISVGGEAMFAPLNVLELVESRWGGHNPHVTEANVRSLDLANGGGRPWPASARRPPQFRPVAEYEAGRAAMIAERTDDPNVQPRFGGFLRLRRRWRLLPPACSGGKPPACPARPLRLATRPDPGPALRRAAPGRAFCVPSVIDGRTRSSLARPTALRTGLVGQSASAGLART